MPTYPYACREGHRWDVIKRMADIDHPEACPTCGDTGMRQVARVNFNGAGDWNRTEWNAGLGCYTKGSKHIAQICKERGLEEVGTTSPETLHRKAEEDRAAAREAGWNKVADEARRDLQQTGVSI